MNPVFRLTELISSLPGLGPKSARRITSYLLRSDARYTKELGSLIASVKDNVHTCAVCGMWCDGDTCDICSSDKREKDKICVVENSDDVITIESCGVYKGLYHILGGRISPFNGVYPENLSFDKLKKRVETEKISEIIIATNPNEEGDTTAVYIKNMLKEHTEIKFTRLSSGIQSGGNIEFATQRALIWSMLNRHSM